MLPLKDFVSTVVSTQAHQHSGSFRKRDGVVDDCLSVEIRRSKEHLWLMVN